MNRNVITIPREQRGREVFLDDHMFWLIPVDFAPDFRFTISGFQIVRARINQKNMVLKGSCGKNTSWA